ncbi:flavodoxin family protein [Polaromonas sp. JS666]|uniref:flavodoxin family protein n=1 Tax=Polaromonas sp. (strain JS666 / ATCC BAA-500) TaxID=296591 RepID=UPI0000463CC5|nr:NAD(P)H-dependent oxidoreductase [Polaromonas sp. JS666]ABE41995.1 NADPH-dependent FMN reductase [Polaromonas sp. JS666]
MTDIRKGQAPAVLSRGVFHERFMQSFMDPAFRAEDSAISRVEQIAWEAYQQGRKAPLTRKAGPGYADPDYELSVEWLETRSRLEKAQAAWQDPATRSRVLLVCGSARNDGTCPGEISKTFRMLQWAQETLQQAQLDTDVLDLSLLTSSYQLHIHPCKGCVSTAMPLCHWPCSCYPNHSLGQTGDWMADIYERWTAAHAVIIVTPVYWYQSPSPLKLMMDRLVCADGGNPDPTSTHGKKPAEAKALEMTGWDYPKHLAGRAYGLVVHGDVAGIEGVRRGLSDWLDWMGLIDAGSQARLDRYVGYYEPYATSHASLDADQPVQAEVRNVAGAVANAVKALRAGTLSQPDQGLARPRPK